VGSLVFAEWRQARRAYPQRSITSCATQAAATLVATTRGFARCRAFLTRLSGLPDYRRAARSLLFDTATGFMLLCVQWERSHGYVEARTIPAHPPIGNDADQLHCRKSVGDEPRRSARFHSRARRVGRRNPRPYDHQSTRAGPLDIAQTRVVSRLKGLLRMAKSNAAWIEQRIASGRSMSGVLRRASPVRYY